MSYPNIFDTEIVKGIINRLESLKSDSQPTWGKMNAAQMLAHLNVAYSYDNGELTVKSNTFKRFL